MVTDIGKTYADKLPIKLINELKEITKDLKTTEAKKVFERAYKDYQKALIEVGETVGIAAAHSMGEPGTQMSMKTFHYAGIAELSLSSGLPRFIEIVDVRKIPRTPSMWVYTKYGNNEEKTKEIAAKLEEVTTEQIADVIEDFQNKKIEVVIDENKIKGIIELDEIAKKIEKSIRKKATNIDGNSIMFEPKTVTLRALRRQTNKIKQAKIYGVPGIKKAAVVEKNGEFIIQTEGTNLKKVLSLDDIDHTRTISNSIKEVEEVLGIEAARNSILNETKAVLDDGGFTVNIRHIMMLADLMTSKGSTTSVGRQGLSGHKPSVFARAAYEETTRHLLDAAVRGTKDKLQGVTENIIVGQPVPIGTGTVKLKMIK